MSFSIEERNFELLNQAVRCRETPELQPMLDQGSLQACVKILELRAAAALLPRNSPAGKPVRQLLGTARHIRGP
jgi:hypothetical protein